MSVLHASSAMYLPRIYLIFSWNVLINGPFGKKLCLVLHLISSFNQLISLLFYCITRASITLTTQLCFVLVIISFYFYGVHIGDTSLIMFLSYLNVLSQQLLKKLGCSVFTKSTPLNTTCDLF